MWLCSLEKEIQLEEEMRRQGHSSCTWLPAGGKHDLNCRKFCYSALGLWNLEALLGTHLVGLFRATADTRSAYRFHLKLLKGRNTQTYTSYCFRRGLLWAASPEKPRLQFNARKLGTCRPTSGCSCFLQPGWVHRHRPYTISDPNPQKAFVATCQAELLHACCTLLQD